MKTAKSMLSGMAGGVIFVITAGIYLQNSLPACMAQDQMSEMAQAAAPAPATKGTLDEQDVAMIERMSKVFRYVAKDVSESVVHITSEKDVKQSDSDNDNSDEEDMLRRFFPDQRFFRVPRPDSKSQPRVVPQKGLGSGVIVGDGLIVTNNHVVDGADKVTVVLPDGREVKPVWVRTDPPTDLALIKVDVKGLKALPLADSDSVEVGDFVLAVGNPFGLDGTVTQGIVSYIGRGVRIGDDDNPKSISYSNYIQTDAAINPGNSGGPLVNLRGQVIGINSAIISRTASYAGIGFAIPSNTVAFVVDQLKKSEQVVRSYIGVSLQPLTLPLAKSFGLDRVDGVLINDVTANTPASKAGLKAGDIILKFNGFKIHNGQQLQAIVSQTPPGKEVKMTLWRDKKEIEVMIKLEKMPKEFLAGKMGGSEGMPEAGERSSLEDIGVTVESLTVDLAKKYNYKPDTKGVIITEVDPAGLGARNGLSEGDLIMKVQNQPVNSLEEFKKAIAKSPFKNGTTLHVRSASGIARFIYIKTE
jgi:serine protease Do